MTGKPPPRLRADARRNQEGIRQAALDVFAREGLTTGLDVVARKAGVSKGTIYHRFGTRQGLIDAVVEELVAERLYGMVSRLETIEDPRERLEHYLRGIWMLQFDEPAVNDVLLRTVPDSQPANELCERACAFGRQALRDAQDAGAVRDDITPDDLYQLILERGIVVRACDQQTRHEYERRLDFVLRGLRA